MVPEHVVFDDILAILGPTSPILIVIFTHNNIVGGATIYVIICQINNTGGRRPFCVILQYYN